MNDEVPQMNMREKLVGIENNGEKQKVIPVVEIGP